jgi:hypothetical protein
MGAQGLGCSPHALIRAGSPDLGTASSLCIFKKIAQKLSFLYVAMINLYRRQSNRACSRSL